MRRAILTVAIAAGLAIGTAIPTLAIGETQIRIGCSDGTTATLVVDADTLTGLTQAVQAMIDYPAGLTCTVAKVPYFGSFGMIALASPGQSPFIVGGGRWLVPCDVVTGGGGGGGGGGTPGAPVQEPPNSVWVNIAVNVHQADDGTFFGTLNETIPANQFCPNFGPVGESHFTSKPQASLTGCFKIDPADPSRGYVVSHVTQTSGQRPFPNGQGGFINDGQDIHFSFKDTGNPGQQATDDRLQGPPAFDNSQCVPDPVTPPVPGDPPSPAFDLVHGNITLHPKP